MTRAFAVCGLPKRVAMRCYLEVLVTSLSGGASKYANKATTALQQTNFSVTPMKAPSAVLSSAVPDRSDHKTPFRTGQHSFDDCVVFLRKPKTVDFLIFMRMFG